MSTKNIAQFLTQIEIPLLAVIYFYFVVSDQVPLAAFGLIVLIWLARWSSTGQLTRTTLFDLPILLLLACLPLSYSVSIYTWQSLPKIYGVLLSVAFFYAIVNAIRTQRDLQWATFWFVVVCADIALAGLVGTDWAQDKIISASFIYDRLPRLIQAVPRSIAGGFARNGVGGTLAFTIPLLTSLIIERRRQTTDSDSIAISLQRWLIPVALTLSLITLALTQSRGGILGAMMGVLFVAIWRERRIAWAVIAGGIGVAILFLLGYGSTLIDFVLRMDARSGTLASRLEVWQRGVMMVRDFPITGIGIGTFNSIAHLLYPFFIAAPNEIVAHAHNQFLEVAVDLGIPGFIAYIGLLAAFIVTTTRAYQNDAAPRALLIGIAGGILAHHIFGLTDAFILGTKPGVVMWVMFAFAAASEKTTALNTRA